MLAPAPLTDRARVAGIAAAITCVAVVGLGLSLSIPLLSIEMERMGASSTMIGLNTAFAGLASLVTIPFVPRLAARTGVMPLLIATILGGAVFLLAFKVLHDFVWWFPIRFLFSAALGALFVLSEFWISAAAPEDRRGLVMGVYATVLAAGFALGPSLLLVFGTEGWPPYLAGTALLLCAALPILLARRLSPQIEPGGEHGTLGYVRLAPAATLAALLYGAVETGCFAILPLYGLKLGFESQSAAGLVGIVALGNVLFAIPIGMLADRIDRGWVLLGASIAGALGAAMLPLASGSPGALGIILFLWGGIAGTLYTVGLADLSARVGRADLAGANATFVLLYSLGLIIGPTLVGAGMDLVVPQGFAYALAGLFVAYSIPAALASRPRATRNGSAH